MLRTHEAGTLRAESAGQTVTLTGWVARRRDHGGVIFIDLRDREGYVQVVCDPDRAEIETRVRKVLAGQLAVDDVQIRPADRARGDADVAWRALERASRARIQGP